MFTKYKPELALADLGLEIFGGVQAYLNPLTIWVKTWSNSQGLMKGLDEKMLDVKKRVSKIARDVVTAGAAAAVAGAGASEGMTASGSSPLQQAFGSLGFGATLMAGGGTSTPTPTPTKGALEGRLKLLEEEVRSLKFGTKNLAIVGQEFASKTAVAAWMKINCPNNRGYLFCVDVHSFLALAFMVKDMESLVKMEVMSKKANYSSLQHMLVPRVSE